MEFIFCVAALGYHCLFECESASNPKYWLLGAPQKIAEGISCNVRKANILM